MRLMNGYGPDGDEWMFQQPHPEPCRFENNMGAAANKLPILAWGDACMGRRFDAKNKRWKQPKDSKDCH
jgi:hypothetical protein